MDDAFLVIAGYWSLGIFGIPVHQVFQSIMERLQLGPSESDMVVLGGVGKLDNGEDFLDIVIIGGDNQISQDKFIGSLGWSRVSLDISNDE